MLNWARYREIKVSGSEIRRAELGRKARVRVRHDGMEASLALKSFKEKGTYIRHLEIPY